MASENQVPIARTLSRQVTQASLEEYRFTPSPRNSPRKPTTGTKLKLEVTDDALPTLQGAGMVLRRSSRRTSKRTVSLSNVDDTDSDDPPARSSPKKRKRVSNGTPSSSSKKPKRGFAPPEQYAHLNFLQDILKEDLDGACDLMSHNILAYLSTLRRL